MKPGMLKLHLATASDDGFIIFGDGDEDGGDGGVASGKGRRNPCGASRWHKMGVPALPLFPRHPLPLNLLLLLLLLQLLL